MADVRAMCAIGLSGQLGLNGRLPWEGNPDREFRADVARFFDTTRGHVLLAGPRTIASVPPWAREDRTVAVIRSGTPPEEARQFHNALLENGVRSVLVTYPEEGHGVRKFPTLFDYAARVVGWFEEHVMARSS